MGRPNVNWNVGIAAEKQSTYTSKAVKAGIPFASQVTEPNTKYIIKYDFGLGGEEVTIPENCILEFDGGSFSNGKLFGDDTYLIMHQDVEDVLKNVRLEGTFKYPKQGNYSDSEELNEIVQQAVQDACTNNETLEQIISNIIFNQLNIEVSEVTTEQIDTLFNQ